MSRDQSSGSRGMGLWNGGKVLRHQDQLTTSNGILIGTGCGGATASLVAGSPATTLDDLGSGHHCHWHWHLRPLTAATGCSVTLCRRRTVCAVTSAVNPRRRRGNVVSSLSRRHGSCSRRITAGPYLLLLRLDGKMLWLGDCCGGRSRRHFGRLLRRA